MTNHVTRLYALAVAVLVLFAAWAVVATHPWQTNSHQAADPRMRALVLRERRIRHDSLVVRRVVTGAGTTITSPSPGETPDRDRAETAQSGARRGGGRPGCPTYSSSPSVQVVTLPPLTITRTS